MEYIDFEYLQEKKDWLKREWSSKRPFHYAVLENFFKAEKSDEIHDNYPKPDLKWDGTTYIHQKNKFQKSVFEPGSLFDKVFKELNSPEMLKYLEEVTGIKNIIADEKLFGGGLHQSVKGAFLNVHVDYNIHPETKFHRRLNLIVYMNKDWKDEYEGFLELWNMKRKERIENIAPHINRMVIFETNEVSFHGHPHPLNTPDNISRKSIATYYYTKERPVHEIANEHNTIYVNTQGSKGKIKTFFSGIKALKERLFGKN